MKLKAALLSISILTASNVYATTSFTCKESCQYFGCTEETPPNGWHYQVTCSTPNPEEFCTCQEDPLYYVDVQTPADPLTEYSGVHEGKYFGRKD